MIDTVGWEVKTWGQFGASLLSVVTVLSALTAVWEASREYRGDVVQGASLTVYAVALDDGLTARAAILGQIY